MTRKLFKPAWLMADNPQTGVTRGELFSHVPGSAISV